MTELLTLHQAANRIGFSKATLRREIAAGNFPPPLRRNKRWLRIPAQHVDAYLQRLATEAQAAHPE